MLVLVNMNSGFFGCRLGTAPTKRDGRYLPLRSVFYLRRTRDAGSSLQDCVRALNLSSSQITRFLQILDLPSDLRHLVDWGRSVHSVVGFTSAVELVRVVCPDDQRAVATAILEQRLTTDEVRQVAQMRKRSGRPIAECLTETVGMRPKVERRYVFIGAVGDDEIQAALAFLTRLERNELLHAGLEFIGLPAASGSLGEQVFTLVGDEQLNRELSRKGRKTIEAQLKSYLCREGRRCALRLRELTYSRRGPSALARTSCATVSSTVTAIGSRPIYMMTTWPTSSVAKGFKISF